MRTSVLNFVVGCLVLLSGCQGAAPPTELQGAVVILLDTVRADRLSCYGHERPTTPNLDRLAAEGVRFESVLADAPWTLPSAISMLTGTYSQRFKNLYLQWSLVEDIRDAGFATAAITEGGFVSRRFKFDTGFSHYEEEEGAVQFRVQGQERTEEPMGGIEHTFRQATRWLEENKDERFFLFIHTYEPHTPYTHDNFARGLPAGAIGNQLPIEMLEEFQSERLRLSTAELEYVRALYDGDIHATDAHLGAFLDELKRLGLEDRSLVVVTSDHGEELGEHYPRFVADHGHSLHDTLLRVPLVIRDPLRSDYQQTVAAQARLVDVMPTVADRLGVVLERPLDGRSLVPMMTGEESQHRLAVSGNTKVGPRRIAIRTGEFKYIETLSPEQSGIRLTPLPAAQRLYDLTADPGERENVVEEHAALAEEMRKLVRGFHKSFERSEMPELDAAADPELLERLKSLGYVR